MKWRTDQIRNVALLGHGSSGKTSLTEALLFKTKAISRQGRIEDGTTTADWDPEEHRRSISINLSVVPVEYDNHKINFLDAPGYLDFAGEVASALHVAEAALVLVDAVAGCEVGTELAWDRLQELEKPRIFFVNKMDRENADFQKALESLRNTLTGASIIPLQLPVGQANDFRGVISLVTMEAYMGPEGKVMPIPDDMQEQVAAAHTLIVEAAAEADDELIMKYLDGEELTAEEVRRGLHLGVETGKIVPVYCGSAIHDIGLERLLPALLRYVPSPEDHIITATRNGSDVELSSKADGPLALSVFKTVIDRYVGRMTYVRNFSGMLNKDDRLTNSRTGHEERIANLFQVRGKDLTAIDELAAGDIGVITKLENVVTGDTLCYATDNIVVPGPIYAQPLYSVAVAPATKADSAKMGQALSTLTEEDPTLRVEVVPATRQTLLHGMGETHVDVALRRMEQKLGVKVEMSMPKVSYQETVSRSASAQYRHKKQTGGSGQFAEVHMRVEPLESGAGFEYKSEVFGGVISGVYLPSIEKGVRQIMEQGVVAGYPVVDIKAVVFDGKEHPVDSKDIAFQTAGREVFRLAVQQADPVILEPIYRIAVTVPEEYMGDIMGDFNTRRGRVQGMEQKGNRTIVRAIVPLAEVMRYGTDLRSMTQGRGTYSLEFDHYEAVPKHLADAIIAQHRVEESEHA
ncbi:MAG: elongation factor G [Caldilineaceae bacterium]|nr:elongation factor G [Caldilineaceae bacterium]